jgi:hypothetical protein
VQELNGIDALVTVHRVGAGWVAFGANLEGPGATPRDALLTLPGAVQEEHEEREAAIRAAFEAARKVAA